MSQPQFTTRERLLIAANVLCELAATPEAGPPSQRAIDAYIAARDEYRAEIGASTGLVLAAT